MDIPNSSSISGFISSITQAVVTFSGAPSRIGVSGFIFDIIGSEDMSIDSDITDHYLENNVAIQDHIALRPEQFTLSGYVGEIASSPVNAGTDILTQLQAFGPVSALLTTFSPQAAQVYNRVSSIANNGQSLLNQAANLYSLFSDLSTTTNKQQNAFQYFYQLWQAGQLCEIETPWGIFENMAILNIRAKQNEMTRLITDFSVTFKKIRFANVLISNATTPSGPSSNSSDVLSANGVTGQAAQSLQSVPDNCGVSSGTAISNSALSLAISSGQVSPLSF